MNINIGCYRLEPEPNSTDKFNIRKESVVDRTKFKQAKNDTVENILAYGVSLERAIDLIVKDRCSDVPGDVELKEYIKVYRSTYKQFQSILDDIMHPKQ